MILLRIFVPFAFGYFLSYFFRTTNALLAPSISNDMSLSPSDIGLVTGMYFIAFASFQMPLGILLDKFGPRKVETYLLVFAVIGSFLFATSNSFFGLLVGRALIGLGVSACLMAALKAYVQFFPSSKLPLLNGLHIASGGIGAIASTYPVELALNYTDWRGIYMVLGALTILASIAIFAIIPEKKEAKSIKPLNEQIGEIKMIFTSPNFIRVAPISVISQSTFLAIQSLWAGLWLRDVAGLKSDIIATNLMCVAGAMVVGSIGFGVIGQKLSLLKISILKTGVIGTVVFLIIQFLIAFNWVPNVTIIWILFGFFALSASLFWAGLQELYPKELSGRVTTSVNFLIFVGAFFFQWFIGIIIQLFPISENGNYSQDGYQLAFLTLAILLLLSVVWYYPISGYVFRNSKKQ